MGNLAPRRQFAQNQPVIIIGCEISKEHVPEELKKFGPGAYAMQSGSTSGLSKFSRAKSASSTPC